MQSSLAVAAGALIGASARWSVGETLASDGFPWATLLVNLVGCAAIGAFAMRLERGTMAWYFVVTGCLGSFTTASAFAADTRQLADDGRGGYALLYVSVSVLGGIAATAGARVRAQRSGT